MISVSGKKWTEQKVDKNLVEKIKQDYNFSEILSKLIVSRNYEYDEINYIKNNLKLINVFNNSTDFNNASDILIDSINKNEKICILGDYDVDGASATSLLASYFSHIKQKYFYYIPDRETDGYGALVDNGDADNFSLTLTGSYTAGNFIFKPEFRIDSASAEIFAISPTETADSLASFVVAAIYSF